MGPRTEVRVPYKFASGERIPSSTLHSDFAVQGEQERPI